MDKEKRNVLLVTLQDNNNIGNRLQNYALQLILEKLRLKVVNLDDGQNDISVKTEVKNLIKYVLSIVGLRRNGIETYYRMKRYQVNRKFTNGYIHNINKVTYTDVYRKDWTAFAAGIVGSDQVWHKWRNDINELPYYYLEFLPEDKRVAYAASFGFEQFPLNNRNQHIEGIKGMNHISCREKKGCDLVESVIHKKVPHVLDPTLLLSPDDWHDLSIDANEYSKSQKNYAFLYFLGELPSEYRKEVQRIINEKNLEVIDFLDFTDKNIANCGPKEFISLIENASYVFTDSFHCCVFSLLFNRRFEVFRRKGPGMEKMFSRIEELLINTGNSEKIFGNVKSKKKPENFERLKADSLEYINRVINNAL